MGAAVFLLWGVAFRVDVDDFFAETLDFAEALDALRVADRELLPETTIV